MEHEMEDDMEREMGHETGREMGHDETTQQRRRLDPRRLARTLEEGITTAEYAVGTAAGAGFAALLYKMLTGGFGDKLLGRFFDHVLALLGIG